MNQTITIATNLTTINCGECGGVYAINERYRREAAEKGKCWHCPYCDCSWGYVEGENARLKKQLAQATAATDQAKAQARDAEARERAAKGQVTKLKKRAAGGVCPCCKRTFQELARHMQTQHPDFATEPAQ